MIYYIIGILFFFMGYVVALVIIVPKANTMEEFISGKANKGDTDSQRFLRAYYYE